MAAATKYGRLKGPFAFYAAYHSNPINQAIHIVCVPLILATAMVFFSYIPLSSYLPSGALAAAQSLAASLPPAARPFLLPRGAASLDASFLLGLCYAAFYVYLSTNWLGLLSALYAMALFVGAQHWRAHSLPVEAAVGLHVFTWAAQFYGHGAHEGRSPALLDNLAQALFMAPMFVFIEVLFALGLLGDLKAEVAPAAQANIAAWRAGKAAKGR